MSSRKNVNPVQQPPRFAEFAARLQSAVEKRGLTQLAFSKLLGVSQGQVSAWFVGRSRPSKLVIKLIALELGVSERWLRDGVGAIYESGHGDKGRVSEPQRDAELYAGLQGADRKALQEFYEFLVE